MSGVFDDTFECSSFNLMVRSGVEGESDDVGDDVAAAVPLDCRGTAAAHVVLFVIRSFLFIFDCFFRLLISVIDDGGISAVIVV